MTASLSIFSYGCDNFVAYILFPIFEQMLWAKSQISFQYKFTDFFLFFNLACSISSYHYFLLMLLSLLKWEGNVELTGTGQGLEPVFF